MRKTTLLAAILALALAATAAFWWLDFRAISSRTQVQQGAASVRFGQGDPARPRHALTIYADGGHLAASIAQATARYLEAQAGFADVEVGSDLPAGSGRPVVTLAIEDSSVLWTPLYARTRLKVAVDYASDGDLSWRGQGVMATTNAHPGVWVDGSIDLTDTTWGIASHRGYEQYLCASLAAQLAKALQSPIYETGYAS
ncbi:MAG: hypothetical protein ACYC5O_16655 [Anaerolineae bacterium]